MSKVPSFKDDKDPSVLKTNGHIDQMTMALIEAACDKEDHVRDRIHRSLVDLGLQQANLVLSSILVFFLKSKRSLPLPHRVLLLKVMKEIVNEKLQKLPQDLCGTLIRLASSELTSTKDMVPEWQNTSSELIVILGTRFGKEVVEELLGKCEPGQVPHYYLVKTLGDFASAHSALVVPCLGDIFSRLLPVMGSVKQDQMRHVVSSAMGRFCESITHYIANRTVTEQDLIQLRDFSGSVFTAYEFLFNVWLQNSNDAKLRTAIVESLGYMAPCLARENLEAQLPKLVPGIMSLYKKTNDHLPITQGLCMVLEVAVRDETKASIDYQLLESILSTLHPLVQIPIDYGVSSSLKNHHELLRCFEILSRSFSDRVVAFLIGKLENSNSANRIATLDLLKHLINACDSELKEKKELILSGMKQVLQEQNLSVRRTFAQVVIAMASKNYLGLEGGGSMVEFIVRQCSIVEDPLEKQRREEKKRSGSSKNIDENRQKAFSELEVTTPLQLRSMCENVLHLITTTLPPMEQILWPYMTEFIIPTQYTEGMSMICKSLGYLANKKRAEKSDDFIINFERQVNVPKGSAMLARLLVLASQPLERQRGHHILHLLLGISPNIRANIPEMWDDVIPKLVAYLEENSDAETFEGKAWEDLLLKFLAKTIDKVGSEDWTVALGEEMGRQMPLYEKYPSFKNFLLRCLGVCMRKSTNKHFLKTHLDLVFAGIDHKEQTEREGAAQCFGFAASSHLDTVLEKLQTVVKNDMVRKSTGFFGLAKDKSESDIERLRSTSMLCYGYTALYAQPALITSRVEVSILNIIIPQFSQARESHARENVTRCVALVCTALLPDRLEDPKFVCGRRSELLTAMMQYISAEKLSIKTQTQALALDAITVMTRISPILSEADRLDIVRTATQHIYELPENADETLLKQAVESLNKLLASIIEENPIFESLVGMIESLSVTIRSEFSHRRQRAMEGTLYIIQQYLKYKREELTENPEEQPDFLGFGKAIGLLAPRCTDSNISVRQNALESIQCLLRVNELIRVGSPEKLEENPAVEAISVLKERAEKCEASTQFSVANDLSKVLSKTLLPTELFTFITELMEGLTDKEDSASSGACVILNGIFKLRGAELASGLNTLLTELHKRLKLIKHEQTEVGTLRSIRTLTSHHMKSMVNEILGFTLPYDERIVKILRTLAGEEATCAPILDNLLTIITKSQPYEEKPNPRHKKEYTREATKLPMQATAALLEIFRAEESHEVLAKNYPRSLCSLMLRIGTANGMGTGRLPIDDAHACFKEFLGRTSSTYVEKALTDANDWDTLKDEDCFFDALTIVITAICGNTPEQIPAIAEFMMPFLSSMYDSQRIVVAAVFAELILQKCGDDENLIEQLMNSLLGRLVDESHVVRKLCIRGLGNVANAPDSIIHRYSTTILSALMAGMDDKNDLEDEITMEAMNGLSKILTRLGENNIRPILINVCLRIRPCFEKTQDGVRAAAIRLFGKLAKFGDGPSKAPFLEQIHSNFVSLLLHLNDDSEEVRSACKSTLKNMGPLLNAAPVNSMLQQYLLEHGSLLYPDFMSDFSKVVVEYFPEKLNFYVMGNVNFFKSDWDRIKCNAALFVAFILRNIPKDKRSLITIEHVCSALVTILQDSSPLVREKAAEAIGLLYDY